MFGEYDTPNFIVGCITTLLVSATLIVVVSIACYKNSVKFDRQNQMTIRTCIENGNQWIHNDCIKVAK